MNNDALKNAMKLIEQARLAKPLLSVALDAIMNDFGPELARAFRAASDFWHDEKARAIKRLEKKGFTREESMLLVCDAEAARQQLLRQMARSHQVRQMKSKCSQPGPTKHGTGAA